MRGIVVIDQPVADRVVGWQVDAGGGRDSAMAGAWVLSAGDPRIGRLLDGRVLVTTDRAAYRFGRGADLSHLAMAIMAETAVLGVAVQAPTDAVGNQPAVDPPEHRPACPRPSAGGSGASAERICARLTRCGGATAQRPRARPPEPTYVRPARRSSRRRPW